MSAQTSPIVIGCGHAEQILALAGAVEAITQAIDDQVDLAPDQLRKDIRGIHHLLTSTTGEIRERVGDWLTIERKIATGEYERCQDCGDIHDAGQQMADHRAHRHAEVDR